MENKQKHLEFIQATISRMANNSFLLKGWAITLVAALFALATKDTDKNYIIVAYFPVVIFWILDGYYLSQERRFRSLYDKVRQMKETEINFSMDASNHNGRENGWIDSIFSKTLLPFYVPLAIIMLVITYLLC
jgi:uncharacterized membrane protein